MNRSLYKIAPAVAIILIGSASAGIVQIEVREDNKSKAQDRAPRDLPPDVRQRIENAVNKANEKTSDRDQTAQQKNAIGTTDRSSKSSVSLKNFQQTRSNKSNRQSAHIGNASKGGRSKVRAENIRQTQSKGRTNSQQLNMGNTSGSGATSDVVAADIEQSQVKGQGNIQIMNVGNASSIEPNRASGDQD